MLPVVVDLIRYLGIDLAVGCCLDLLLLFDILQVMALDLVILIVDGHHLIVLLFSCLFVLISMLYLIQWRECLGVIVLVCVVDSVILEIDCWCLAFG